MNTAEVKESVLLHAREEAPRECCGFIVNTPQGKTRAVRAVNSSPEPEVSFTMEPSEWDKAEAEGEIVAVYHSHPNAPATPSESDIASAEAIELPFLICAFPADEERNAQMCMPERVQWELYTPKGFEFPYEHRPFLYGILDCYSIVRDFYKREFSIELPNFYRAHDWWEKGQDMYRDLFPKHGFVRLANLADVQRGDILLTYIRSTVPNHAAIYLGDGLILHHPPMRSSIVEPFVVGNGFYATQTFCALRHESLFDKTQAA
jgi:proteasome lid subunit RPN8/RPN11